MRQREGKSIILIEMRLREETEVRNMNVRGFCK